MIDDDDGLSAADLRQFYGPSCVPKAQRWPFPPAEGPTPWTHAQERAYQRQRKANEPEPEEAPL